MSETTGPLSDITEEAARVIDVAQIGGFPLRLPGGLAMYFQCPRTKSDQRLSRVYKDLDVVTLNKWDAKTMGLFTRLGYTANKNFNALQGHQRLLLGDPQHERQVDILIDRMQMEASPKSLAWKARSIVGERVHWYELLEEKR